MADPNVKLLIPKNDTREYRCTKLSNDLQVLLIRDSDTDKAAAAMSVGVGYFCDPENAPGLSHFLEHMLFYSSEKYPEEDSYSKFLTEHGGRSNAYTSTEQTNFHFDVNHEFLEEALDRFAQFFICPLFSKDATFREIKAVDSENSKNLNSDAWRFNQLEKHLSSPSHPFYKYGTGNIETLQNIPQSKGEDIREILIQFYNEFYSSNLMHLVVYGRNNLDELEKMVNEKFSLIKNKNKTKFLFPGNPCEEKFRKIFVKTVPVCDTNSLHLQWPNVSFLKNYHSSPYRYLGHLIGHEAEGSLFSLLKAKRWASSLSAGESATSLEFTFFDIVIELTEEGNDHVDDIMNLVFQYIHILKTEGIKDWIFEELRCVCDIKFHFQDKRSPFQIVSTLSSNMINYDVNDWIVGDKLPRDFDFEKINLALSNLNPQNLRIFWISKNFENDCNEIEPWYKTKYLCENISNDTIEKWTKYSPENLFVPLPNDFIPSDFDLKQSKYTSKFPKLVYKSKFCSLWFKKDDDFFIPKAYVYIDFISPFSYSSPEAGALTRLFVKLLIDELNENAYYAEIAGLEYDIEVTVLGFHVKVGGYNHKLFNLLEKIISKLVTLNINEERFDVVKEKLMKDFKNFEYQQPYSQCLYSFSVCIEQKKWHRNEYMKILPSLNHMHLKEFHNKLFTRISFDSFIIGNITEEEAIRVSKSVENVFTNRNHVLSQNLFFSELPERRILKLPENKNFFSSSPVLNPADSNSALVHYLQIDQDFPKSNVLSQLFVQISKRDAFHQLRSVEQLGYIVTLIPRNNLGVRGVSVIIQSNSKKPLYLEERVELFLEKMEEKIVNMSETEFKMNVEALIAQRLEKRKSLFEESEHFWKEIEDGTLFFDRVFVEVEELKKITLQEMVHFYQTYIKLGGQKRKKLSLHVVGGDEKEKTSEEEDDVDVDGDVKNKNDANDAKTHENGVKDDSLTANGVEQKASSPSPSSSILAYNEQINDVYAFKRSCMLYPSIKGRANASSSL